MKKRRIQTPEQFRAAREKIGSRVAYCRALGMDPVAGAHRLSRWECGRSEIPPEALLLMQAASEGWRP